MRAMAGVEFNRLDHKASLRLTSSPVRADCPVAPADDVGRRNICSQVDGLPVRQLRYKRPHRCQTPLQAGQVAIVEEEVRGKDGITRRISAKPSPLNTFVESGSTSRAERAARPG